MNYKAVIKRLRATLKAAERNPMLYSDEELSYLRGQLRVLIAGREAENQARRQIQGFTK